MIILAVAILCSIIMAVLFFTFKYTRIIGGYQEQHTAIESAALAAASDLSKIVVLDPYFGYIGLSDSAPSGSATAAQDGFGMPVQGINTILATVRLDMIIADALENTLMQQCARRDYKMAMSASNGLVTALQSAITRTGQGEDENGNVIEPQKDAITAYKSCVQRMNGTRTRLVPGTLTLSLGCIAQATTNIPAPQPGSIAQVPNDLQQNGCYVAYVDQPYKASDGTTYDFVYAGTTSNTILVDYKKFAQTIPALPYTVPTLILCQADQIFNDVDMQGNTANRTIHAVACAEPASNLDPRPHPGALTISFPNGFISTLQKPLDLFNKVSLAESPCDYFQTPVLGDYPESPLTYSQLSLPSVTVPGHPTVVQAETVAFYDWIRRGGFRVNAQALIDMLQTPFDQSYPAGSIHAYEFNKQGNINYVVFQSSIASWRVSQNQWQAISGLAASDQTNTGQRFDIVIKDSCYQPGTFNNVGGMHGGEPLSNQLPFNSNPPNMISELMDGQKAFAGQTSPGTQNFPSPKGSGLRPTYNPKSADQMGQSADIRFRLHGAQ